MIRQLRHLVLVVAIPAVVIGVVLVFVRPLVPSRDYEVSATQDGVPIRAELLHPLLNPATHYIHLPDEQTRLQPGAPPRIYEWFGVELSRKSVFSPISIYHGVHGLYYIHSDQVGGIGLTDPKSEDHWQVTFTENGAQFANGRLAVTFAKAP